FGSTRLGLVEVEAWPQLTCPYSRACDGKRDKGWVLQTWSDSSVSEGTSMRGLGLDRVCFQWLAVMARGVSCLASAANDPLPTLVLRSEWPRFRTAAGYPGQRRVLSFGFRSHGNFTRSSQVCLGGVLCSASGGASSSRSSAARQRGRLGRARRSACVASAC